MSIHTTLWWMTLTIELRSDSTWWFNDKVGNKINYHRRKGYVCLMSKFNLNVFSEWNLFCLMPWFMYIVLRTLYVRVSLFMWVLFCMYSRLFLEALHLYCGCKYWYTWWHGSSLDTLCISPLLVNVTCISGVILSIIQTLYSSGYSRGLIPISFKFMQVIEAP